MNTENTQEPAEGVVAYEDMSWQKLKALMTVEGQDWVNAEHAIKYLGDLDAADDSAGSDETDATTDADAGVTDDAEQTDLAPDGSLGSDLVDGSTDGPTGDKSEDDDVIGGDDLITEPEDEANGEPVFYPDDKHGVISGQCNARYWQNGCHYGSDGQYIAPEDVVVTPEETD